MRILFLNKRILFPPDTGGKIRTLNVLRYLARWHEVTYLCNIQAGEEEPAREMRELGVRLETVPWREPSRGGTEFYVGLALNLFSRFPFNVNKDYDRRLRRRAEQLLAAESYDLVVCDFVQMARNAINVCKLPKVLFEHNVEAEIFRRHAQTDSGMLRRLYMRHQWCKMRRFEAEAGRQFDAVVAVSPRDRTIYENEYGWRHAQVIDTGVDLDYFSPNGFAEVPDRVLFIGSMDWFPNEDGVRHFVHNIWPEIRKRRPKATFQVVGRNPTSSVKRLGATPGVDIVGTVPDVRPYLSEASVVVVPLRIGGGTRIKIFEAMAMRKPVVSTALGAEGLAVVNGRHAVIADAPGAFADAIVGLFEDSDRRMRLATCAHQLVVENYSAEVVARQFEQICLQSVFDASQSGRMVQCS